METISSSEARSQLAEIFDRVAYGGEQIVLTRNGKPLVALIPIADLERLDTYEVQSTPLDNPERNQVE